MVVPGRGGEVHEYHVTLRQLRAVQAVVVGGVVFGLALLFGLGVTVPRSNAYSGLLEENFALREQLQEVDRNLGEVDRILLRLRLYDAQMRSLGDPRGDAGGPLPTGLPLPPGLPLANDELPRPKPPPPTARRWKTPGCRSRRPARRRSARRCSGPRGFASASTASSSSSARPSRISSAG